MIQGSAEWLALRAGKITASRVADVMASGRGGAESATRAKYRTQIIAERLLGGPCEDGFESDAMRRGTEQEPFARAAYEVDQNVMVDQVAFFTHPSIPNAGASPDGLVGEDGGVEIKCPNTATHIKWLLADRVPPEHVAQMMWCMAVTERQWWDFVSYDSRLADTDLHLFVKRLDADPKMIAEMESAVRTFDAECAAAVARLRAHEVAA